MICSRKIYSILFIFSLVANSACNPDLVPLKGTYENNPLEITSSQSIDIIWSNLADLFAANGLSIKNLDKTTGVFASKKTTFIPVYTFEDKNGQLKKAEAWVVLPKVVYKDKELTPKKITVKWNIRIVKNGDGTNTIMVDPLVICNYSSNMLTSVEVWGQSTGKLEELIERFANK